MGVPTHLLTAKSRISAECPRYSLIIFPERASQSRTTPSRLQVYTTAELSSHSNCTIPDWDRGRPHHEHWRPPARLGFPHVPPCAVCHPPPTEKLLPRAKLWGAFCVQGLWLPLGKPRGQREKHKLGTGSRKAPGLQGKSQIGPKTAPGPRERGQGSTSCWHLCLRLCVERS